MLCSSNQTGHKPLQYFRDLPKPFNKGLWHYLSKFYNQLFLVFKIYFFIPLRWSNFSGPIWGPNLSLFLFILSPLQKSVLISKTPSRIDLFGTTYSLFDGWTDEGRTDVWVLPKSFFKLAQLCFKMVKIPKFSKSYSCGKFS